MGTSRDVDRFDLRLKTQLLSFEIKITNKRIYHIRNNIREIKASATGILPAHIVAEYQFFLTHSYNRNFNKIKRDNIRKFNDLNTHHIEKIHVKSSWFKNLSNVQIPDDVVKILALGPKFSVAPNNRDLKARHILSDVENIVKNLSPQSQNIVRAQATNIITNFFYKNAGNNSFITSLYSKAKKFLKSNDQLLIVKSDKGNVTVAINKSDYHNKVLTLLNDELVYKKLNRDPTSNIIRQNNDLVKKLQRGRYIDDITAKKLKTYKGISPRLYGVVKIHKEDCPVRPIVSTVNSPTSELVKFITKILTVSFQEYNQFSIKNSAIFAAKVNDLQLPDGYVLVSLDVVSLFTNIPLQLTIDVITEEWQLIQDNTDIPLEEFIHILEFIFNSNYLLYLGQHYSQTFGCPMGSNISPVLANIIMTKVLKHSISRLHFQPPFLFQYVDDLILSIPEGSSQSTLEIFNSYNQHIQFTIEEEKNMAVPFLDTLVIRTENNRVQLDWYQKPTSSGKYINFQSYHNSKMKYNVILGMKKRIYDITHPSRRDAAIRRLFNIMLDNGYPEKILNRLIYQAPRQPTPLIIQSDRQSRVIQPEVALTTPQHPCQPPSDTQAALPLTHEADQDAVHARRYAVLPYIEGLTHKLVTLFSKNDVHLKIAQYNLLTNKSLFTTNKDPVPTLHRHDVVYQITCHGCNLSYIGQTSQTIKQRITLHKSDVRLNNTRCALSAHVSETNHSMNFEDVKILEHNRVLSRRLFLEMCHINNNVNSINNRSDIDSLSSIYSFLLSLDKQDSLLHDITSSTSS